jgi:multidrug transporter EmrE-like cation transporter
MLAGIGLSLLSALVINAGNLIEKVAVDRLPGFSARRTTHMLRTLLSSKLWLLGVVVSVAGLAFQVVAFALAPIAVVQSIFCGGLVFLVVVSRLHLHEPLHRTELVGLSVVVLALLLVSLSLAGSSDDVGVEGSVWTVVVAGAATAVTVGGLFFLVRRRSASASFTTGIAAGLLYGAAALGTKGASTLVARDGLVGAVPHVFASPYPYVFLVFCGLGTLVFQTGLQRGRIAVIGPLTNVVASAYLVAVGMAVFGEHLPGDPTVLTLRIAGFAGVLVGSCLLASGGVGVVGFGAGPVTEPDLGLGPVLEAEIGELVGRSDAPGPADSSASGD